ncbi:MAG: hypothetical protein HKO07_04575 [Pseudomonadales bacterium]|nr:hypothetical protein [Pseudomonadales bacterium]
MFIAVSSEGALLEAPLSVLHTGRGSTAIGEHTQATGGSTTLDRAELFKALGFPAQLNIDCTHNSNIHRAVLQKVFINCVINPLTAMFNCRNGELLSNARYHASFVALCAELQAVYNALERESNSAAAAAGEPAPKAFELAQRAAKVARATAANQSSMLSDWLAGRRLELDSLNCHIGEAARELGIACPLNTGIIEQLQPKR